MIKYNVYALNWNESRLIPAFLHHYREAHRIIVYDNESTDDSVSLILNAKREVVSFKSDNTFDDQINIDLKNRIWKDAREEDIDFVIVQDLDEFIFFPKWPKNISQALIEYKANGITCAMCMGYNIVCTDADWDNLLNHLTNVDKNQTDRFNFDFLAGAAQIINRGYRFLNEDKVLLFNPREIIETNYGHGAHNWSPEGKVVFPLESPALLHYKYIGKMYSQKMIGSKRDRLSEKNRINKWGWEYLISDEDIDCKLSNLEQINFASVINSINEYHEKCKSFQNVVTTILVLERDSRRYWHVQRNCLPFVINYRFQSAMDNTKIDDLQNFRKLHNIQINKDYLESALMGAIACSFSHMQAWDHQIRNGIRHMIILEDDCLIGKDFNLDTTNIFSELDQDYDFVYLFIFPEHYKNDDEVSIQGKQFVNLGYRTWCTVAYLLSLQGAKKLWDRLQFNLSDNVDNIISEMIESKSLKAYTAKKQYVQCLGQSVPWDEDPNKLPSNIWSSPGAKDLMGLL